MVGTACRLRPGAEPRPFMAAKAPGMSRAAPQASPEWIPTAANRSG